MRGQAGFWDFDERYLLLSGSAPLKKLNAVVAREVFRKPLGRSPRDGLRR